MYVTASGLVCAVGLDAPSACVALRANIPGFTELPYRDNRGEPIVGAIVPDLDVRMPRETRIVQLLAAAVTDLLGRAPGLTTGSVPLLIGLAEPGRPGGTAGLADTVLGQVQDRLKVKFHPASQVRTTGHTAGVDGLRAARQLMTDAKVQACVVCAADSYANASSLVWLDRHLRLKTPENSDGVIPGEAGAAVLVTAAQPTAGPPVRVRGLGFAHEPAHVLNDEPILGLGLAEAGRQALAEAGLAMHEVEWRTADVTGEQYGFKELALVLPRLMRQRREDFPVWHPAQSVGDTGAAAGLVGLAVIREAFAKGYAPGPRVMLTTAAVGGARAAAVITGDEP